MKEKKRKSGEMEKKQSKVAHDLPIKQYGGNTFHHHGRLSEKENKKGKLFAFLQVLLKS